MIITENREKVKRKAISLINKADEHLSKPEKKFMLEMMMGMLRTGSCNLTRIAVSRHEAIRVKDTLKRLCRMLGRDNFLDIANTICLEVIRGKVYEKTILALDGGDMNHQYGEKVHSRTHPGAAGKPVF